jgi:hypothetical protein
MMHPPYDPKDQAIRQIISGPGPTLEIDPEVFTSATAARAAVAGTYRQEEILMLRTCGLVLAVALLMGACGGGGGRGNT